MTQSTSESIPIKQVLGLALIAGMSREQELRDQVGYQQDRILQLSAEKATAERELREERDRNEALAGLANGRAIQIEELRDQVDDLTNWLEREVEAGKSKDRVISAKGRDIDELVAEIAGLEQELATYKADYADLHAEVMDKRDRLDRLAQYETPSATAFSRIDEHLGLNQLKVGDRVTVTEPYEGLGGVFDDRRTVHPGDSGTILELDLYTLSGVEAAHIHWDNESDANLPPLSILTKVEG